MMLTRMRWGVLVVMRGRGRGTRMASGIAATPPTEKKSWEMGEH